MYQRKIETAFNNLKNRMINSNTYICFVSKIQKYKNYEEPIYIEKITFYLIAIFLFLNVVGYGDYIGILKISLVFNDAIFKGRILDVYQYMAENIDYTVVPAVWEITLYAIIGIFMLPISIIKWITGVDIINFKVGIFYGKLFLVFITYLSGNIIKRVINKVTKDEKIANWSFLIFLTSIQIYLHSFGVGRYDIVSVLVMLKIVETAIERKTYSFIFWSAIGITLKSFALFLFFPILLYYNKSICKILIKTLFCLSLQIIYILWYHKDPAYISSGVFFRKIVSANLFMSHTFPIYIGLASLVVVMFVIICCYMYSIKPNDNILYNFKNINYSALFIFTGIFLFMGFHPNWITILVPFTTFSIFINRERFKLNLILETILYFVLAISFIYVQSTTYGTGVFYNLYLSDFLNISEKSYISIFELLGIANSQMIGSILMGLFFGISIVFLYINLPQNVKNEIVEIRDIRENKGLIYIRSITIIVYIIVLLIPALVEKPKNDLLLNYSQNCYKSEQRLIDETTFNQYFYVPSNMKLNSIKLNFESEKLNNPEYDIIVIECRVFDKFGNILYEKFINNSSFPDNSYFGGDIYLDFKNKVLFDIDKKYVLQLKTKNATYNKTWAPMVVSNKFNDEKIYLEIDGKKSETILAMEFFGEYVEKKDLNSEITDIKYKLNKNDEFIINVRLKNTGNGIWREIENIRLGFGINGVVRDDLRGKLPLGKNIKQGDEYEYEVNLGKLNYDDIISLQMVKEGVEWFGDRKEFKVKDVLN